MKISASIYSSKEEDLKSLVQELDEHKIDLFHIDCNDDLAVFEDIKEIRKYSNTPIDLHIISSYPEKFYEHIEEYNIEWVTFQYEDLTETLNIPKTITSKLGLSITSETDIDVFDPYIDSFNHILFMATTPGKSGGSFNKENFQKIRKFSQKFPKKKIHVDGGVNDELSFILRNLGVYLSVVGSYLFKSNYVGVSLLNLKSDDIESRYLVKDIMKVEKLPILNKSNHSLRDILQSIEDHNLGFTVIVGDFNKMEGIITNADVRRAILKNYDNFENINTNDIINTNPVFINQNKTISELIHLVRNLSFPLLYLPVTNNSKEIVGTITFNNLIRGES